MGDATSSPDNTAGINAEQGLRPRGQAPWLPSQLRHTQPRPSRVPPRQGETLKDPSHKWVIKLSSKPLTQAQRSLLAKGPNYSIAPRHPSNLEYITGIESVCTKLSQQDAEELRANINRGSYPQVYF